MTIPLDIDAPVTAEVFTLVREGESLVLTGPCGSAPWLIETDRGEHPLDTVRRIVDDSVAGLLLLHSTSWRHERDSVMLTFVAVVDDPRDMDGVVVARTELARSAATHAPSTIAADQVLEHAIRHLAWLVGTDDVVRSTLDDQWHAILRSYVPEPFQQLR
ncbi:MAG: hypothetical protein ACLGHX_04385 [Acidimicrobiia bacterium]